MIHSHLGNIIKHHLDNNSFPEGAKIATVRPFYKKKNDRGKIENYRPVSILNCFSNIYERFLNEQFKSFVETFLRGVFATYRKSYSCNVLIPLIESWKKVLEENIQIGTVVMDLFTIFSSTPRVYPQSDPFYYILWWLARGIKEFWRL